MSGRTVKINESRHCPVCEYDLRGNTSGRCPECGSPILGASSSRLPWLHQQARGGIRAYLQTMALLLFKPGELAKETQQRIQRRPARRFHHESIALATFIGAGMFAIIFLLRGAAWETFLNPGIDVLFGQRGTARIWWMPMYVWADRLQILIPFVPALYISLWISAWFYRLVFRLGGNSEIARRRAGRLAYYGSGLTPVMMILAGILTLLCILMNDEWNWVIGGWKPVLFVAAILFSIVLPVAFYYPTLTLLIRAGKGSVRNVLAMVLLFPLAAAGACALSFIAVFWIFGYVAVAFWAMAH